MKSQRIVGWVSLLALIFAKPAIGEPAVLRVSTEPALPVVSQLDGHMTFSVLQAAQVQLRVRALHGGELSDVTTSCSFTPASSLISVTTNGVLSIAASPTRTLEAVEIECGDDREIVGFELAGEGS